MPQYRIHKSNLPQHIPSAGEGFTFIRVSSNAGGVTLSRMAFSELPVVRHAVTGIRGRRATVITGSEPDRDDPNWIVCTTTDVILPYEEKDLSLGPESDWK